MKEVRSKPVKAMAVGQLPIEQRLHFRNELREARERAYADAEDYDHVVHVIERLGSYLSGEQRDLNSYRGKICLEAEVRGLQRGVDG